MASQLYHHKTRTFLGLHDATVETSGTHVVVRTNHNTIVFVDEQAFTVHESTVTLAREGHMLHGASQRSSFLRRVFSFFLVVATLATTLPNALVHDALGQDALDQDSLDRDDDIKKQQMLADRFEKMLLRSPRRGTALDRVYGHYAETGTLDTLVQRYESETAATPHDANKWIVLGLLEAKRGNDARAIKALQQAESADKTNAMASYYLGQSLLLVGKSAEATEAIERGIAKKPRRADMLVMYQTLGRIHQRAHRNEKALEVWNRLEKQFPGDQRVAEQIATALAEEEQFDEALRRYQALAKRTKDDLYRRVIYRMEAANMTLRLGKKQDALSQFEQLLSSLKPDSWLHQQVRSRIESVYRQADDLAGLATYYEKWLSNHADDLGAMSRLASTLSSIGRAEEARKWFDKAIELAPTRADLRQSLIDQLVYEKKYSEAIKQYAELDKSDPNNPDYVRQWGLLVLRDKSENDATRKDKAAKVWLRLSNARPNDAVTATQVADLLRQADAVDEAERLYKKAVELNPAEAQYREYLGEFYHEQEDKEKALVAWKQIAEPPRRSGETLHRLAEVLSGFGYDEPAIQAAAAACELAQDDFTIHMTYVDLLADEAKYKEVLPLLEHMDTIAENLEQTEAILDRRVQSLQGAELLDDRLETLKTELATGTDATAERWRLLGRFHEAKREMPEAIAATQKAIEIDDRSIPATRMIARLHETVGEIGMAANDNRRLAVIDPQFKTNYLTEVANLEARLGRIDEALKAGRDLIAAAPNNPEHYQFFARLCFQLGKNDEGLATLRRAVRANPSDLEQLLALGSALAEQFRNTEAIELYWQAFEKATEVDDQVNVINKLTELYLNQNQFDSLLERLERMRRETDQDRALTFCVAAAHLTAQDYGAARSELSVYLATNDRDTDLLQQVATIAEKEGNIEAAIQYRARLNQIAPSDQGRRKLAQLYMQTEQGDEAEQILANLAMEQTQRFRVLKSVDELLAYDRFAGAATIIAALVRDQPDDWEAIYRDGVSLAKQDKSAEAKEQFERILEIATDDDEPSAAEKERQKKSAKKTTRPNAYYGMMSGPNMRLVNRVQRVYEVRRAIGLDNYRSSSSQRTIWMPKDAGQARLAAMGWLTKLAMGNEEETNVLKNRFTADTDIDEAPTDDQRRDLHDGLYYAAVTNDAPPQLDIAKALSHDGTVQSQAYYLSQLPRRGQPNRRTRGEDKTEPLPDAELDHVVECYKNVSKSEKQSRYYLSFVLTELKRADRQDQEKELYAAEAEKVNDVTSAMALLNVAVGRADIDETKKLMAAVERLAATNQNQLRNVTARISQSLNRMVWALKEDEQTDQVLPLLDRYWQFARTIRDRTPSYLNRRQRTSRQQTNFGVQIRKGGNHQYQQLNFPQPSKQFDAAEIGLLRNVFAIFQEDENTDALLSHLESRLSPSANEAANEAAALEAIHKSIAAVNWWNGEQDAAVESLEKLTEQNPDDVNLKFSLVDIYNQTGDLETALETLESIDAFDQSSVARRENLTLNIAVQLGDIERARAAAEYLFGIRLSSQEQIQLAQQMHTIGLHNLAEAVLRRAQRRTGGDRNQLMAIMNSYAQQGKMDIAVQVAQQVLRTRAPRSNHYNSNSRDQVREQALRLLSQSGKLKELIARGEEQRERSPNSTRILKMLSEYYAAANQPEKSRALLLKLADLSPKDGKSRYQLAETLRASGDQDAALDQYLMAFRLDPNLYSNRYYEIERMFRDKERLPDLAKAFLEADLTKISQPYYLSNMLQYLLREEDNHELGMDLFAKLWEATPNYRYYIISSLNTGDKKEAYKDPRILKYARESFFGTQPNYANVQAPWQAMSTIHSWSSDAVNSTVDMLLESAEAQDALSDLRKQADEKLAKEDDWKSGIALKALIDLREGKIDEANVVLEKLIADKDAAPGSNACMVIGQEARKHDELVDLTQRIYEHASNPENDNRQGLDFEYGPGKQLLEIYKKKKETQKAIALLREVSKRPTNNQYDPQYAAYQLLQRQINVGKELMELKQPLDAIRAYRRLTPTQMETASQWGGSHYTNLFNEGFAAAKAALKSNMIIDDLLVTFTLSETPPTEGSDVEADSTKQAKTSKKKKAKTPSEQAIEYIVAVETKGKRAGTITSPIADAISKTKPSSKKLKTLREALASQENTSDYSVAVMRVLAEVRAGDKEPIANAIAALNQLVADNPLTEITKKRPTTKQRRVAKDRIVIWLAALAVLESDKEQLSEEGKQLARASIESARRQLDTSYAAAMLQQLGSLAIERDDKASAEEYWREMLEILIGRELTTSDKDENKTSMRGGTSGRLRLPTLHPHNAIYDAIVCASPPLSALHRILITRQVCQVNAFRIQAAPLTPATSKPNPRGTATKGIRPVNNTAFDAATKLAKLAIKNGMPDLSLQCMHETLRAGPPIKLSPGNDSTSRFAYSTGNNGSAQTDKNRVIKALNELRPLWERHDVSSQAVYELFRDTVMPPDRPGEVFLYENRLQLNTNPPIVSSLSQQLAEAAVKAKTVDELRELVTQRGEKPLAKLPALVVEAQLADAANDADYARDVLDRLTTRVQTDSQLNTLQMACYAAVPLLERDETNAKAHTTLDLVLENAKSTANPSPLPHQLAMLLIRDSNGSNPTDVTVARLKELETVASNAYIQSSNPRSYHQQILEIGNEYARLGKIDSALAMLGKAEDLPQNRIGSSGRSSIGKLLTHIRDRLDAMPTAERFTTLRDWIMPAPQRNTLRIGTSILSAQHAPHVIDRRQPADSAPESPSLTNSNWLSLVETLMSDAKELGRFDELSNELSKLKEEKLAAAETLAMIATLKTAEPFSHKQTKRLVDDFTKQTTSKRGIPIEFHLLNRELHRVPDLQSTADSMFHRLSHVARKNHYSSGLVHMRLHRMNALMETEGVSFDQVDASQLLPHWTASRILSLSANQQSYVPTRWLIQDDLLVYSTGTKYNRMVLNYPLTGEFEFSADIVDGTWSEGSLSFGGTLINVEEWDKRAQLADIGNHNKSTRIFVPTMRAGFNRWTVKSDGEDVEFSIKGRLVHRQPVKGNTCPWIMFCSEGGRQSYFANPRLKGDFEIPQTVQLIAGNRMDGWAAKAYGESIPKQVTAIKPTETEQEKAKSEKDEDEGEGEGDDEGEGEEGESVAFDPNAFDWSVNEGTLYGRHLSESSGPRPSRLIHARPLLDGETISYQYFYEPNAIDVSPAIGRIVFGFQPSGLRLHWMQHHSVVDLSDLTADHWVKPNMNGLPTGWKLNENDWNSVTIRRDTDTVSLTLNGDDVGTIPVTPERGLSFFHFKDQTESRIRDVVLTGNWPTTLDDKTRNHLFAHDPPSANAQSVVSRMIDDQFYLQRVDDLMATTSSLNDTNRYDALVDWVLPNDRDPAFRIYGSPQRWWQPNKSTIERKSIHDYYALPAFALVDTAKQLGRLDELAHRISDCHPNNPVAESAQTVLLAMVAAADDDIATAKTHLTKLNDQIINSDPERRYIDRWPELLGMLLAERHQELRSTIKPYVEHLASRLWKSDAFPSHWVEAYAEQSGRKAYVRIFRSIRAAFQHQSSMFGDQPHQVLQTRGHPWVVYSYPQATTSGLGVPPSVWSLRDDTLISRSGHLYDNVMYNVPLQGDFELSFETKGWGNNIVRVGYAGKIGRLSTSGTKFYTNDYHGGHKNHKLKTKVDKQEGWFTMKLKVVDGKCSYHLNDQRLYEYKLPDDHDGWLFLNARPTSLTRVRNIQISGNPDVPDSFSVMPPEDIHNWIRYYDTRVTRDLTKWDLTGGELKAKKFGKSPECDFEHLVSYHRPLLEDATFEYEFYYQAGKTLTHPAIGRLAMLLKPQGVMEHWITDAQFETSDISPGNRTLVDAHQRTETGLPLKDGKWNKMRFEFADGLVTLSLNDTEIYQRKAPTATFQTFGLFHFADQTAARVRNIRYSGDWAKELK